MLRWIKDIKDINLSGCCNAIFIQVFVDQIFRIFDKDGNGSIDFKVIKLDVPDIGDLQEFMMATDMTASGSPEEKLRWAFKMYDKDGSGEWKC